MHSNTDVARQRVQDIMNNIMYGVCSDMFHSVKITEASRFYRAFMVRAEEALHVYRGFMCKNQRIQGRSHAQKYRCCKGAAPGYYEQDYVRTMFGQVFTVSI